MTFSTHFHCGADGGNPKKDVRVESGSDPWRPSHEMAHLLKGSPQFLPLGDPGKGVSIKTGLTQPLPSKPDTSHQTASTEFP